MLIQLQKLTIFLPHILFQDSLQYIFIKLHKHTADNESSIFQEGEKFKSEGLVTASPGDIHNFVIYKFIAKDWLYFLTKRAYANAMTQMALLNKTASLNLLDSTPTMRPWTSCNKIIIQTNKNH